MITLNSSVISRIIMRKTCSTVILTNYEKCPVELLETVSKVSFVVNTTQYYPDLVCVVPHEKLPELRAELYEACSWIKVE